MVESASLIIVITLFINLLNKAILFLQFKTAQPAYDHYYHLSLIKGIELNKHRFLKNSPTYLAERSFFYPQLYHWILSFFGARWVEERFNNISTVISLLVTFTILYFSYLLHKEFFITIPFISFIVSVGFIYWITPFNFYLWNAKNRGLSVRGFGLLLGLWYQFSVIGFILHPEIGFYVSIVLLATLIILSSQFTFQFVLFSAAFFALFYHNVWLLFPPLFAIAIYLVILPTHAISFLRGQYYHKKIWFLYLSDISLKNTRYSIWRDLVYDIWKKKDMKYLLDNAVISVMVGIPTLVVTTGLFCWNYFNLEASISYIEKIIGIQVIVCLLVSILTSFRKTRFLGEPERYAEFAIPFITVLLVINTWQNTWILLIIAAFSFSVITYHYALFGFQKFKTPEHILFIKNYIEQQSSASEFRIFSNNTSALNYFINDLRFKILQPDITYEYTGSFHFNEIFPDEYFRVNPNVIMTLITEFNIEWFVLDTHMMTEELFQQFNNNIMSKGTEYFHFIIYKRH